MNMMMSENENENDGREQIAFFDVETTIPYRQGQGYSILEFASVLVCPRKLEELDCYSTLVKPLPNHPITTKSIQCNAITKDAVANAPSFADIADKVYDLLQGRIWAGHNIIRFDCKRINEAFAHIAKPPPQPKGFIDTLQLLTLRFGRRAGDMKMATLANYFGLGQQTHRSLDDVRMNIEVVKYCATVLFLESSLPDLFTENSRLSPNSTARIPSVVNSSPGNETIQNSRSPGTESHQTPEFSQTNPLLSLLTESSTEESSDPDTSYSADTDPFNMSPLSDSMNTEETPQADVSIGEKPESESSEFLDPNQVSIASITASFVPWFRGIQRVQLLHNDMPMLLHCACLRVRFGLSTKFTDNFGRPRLNIMVDTSPSLCKVLEACDSIAKSLTLESGSSSDWKNVVCMNKGYFNNPTARLQ
ncbi:hypothetical protein ACFE04_024705 [Oxalis oulophora]